MYLATLDCATSNPSLSSSPWIRGAPQVAWDLVVIDEAHRLRNVYKTSSRIALAIKQAVSSFPKVLLTATPLQNSLLELYGLVSIIDDFAFGDLNSFRARFARLGSSSKIGLCCSGSLVRASILVNFLSPPIKRSPR
jgi:hypothetical protein